MTVQIPWKLQEAVRANNLVIFLGAGASRSAGLPLWSDIVIDVLRHPSVEKSEDYQMALKSGIISPLFVLDALENAHRKEVYDTFEASTSKTIDSEIHKALSRISRKFVTTNYDKLIEHNTQIKYVDPSSSYHLQKLDNADEYVLKIHGTCDTIDKCVIFSSDYKALYSTDSVLAKFQLQKIVSSHTCLFIGFSLTDEYVVDLFNYLNKLYDSLGITHFAISTNELRHDFVETIKINDHADLPGLISELAALKEICSSIEVQVEKKEGDNEKLVDITGGGDIRLVIRQDTPPKVENWTGRINELKALGMDHRACFITGIGGQGKSALASRFLSGANRNLYKFCVWKDFKEEELNFQSKLYSLIELVSEGRLTTNTLIGLDTSVLIDTFFQNLGEQTGIFVFDNIDKYIDLDRFTPAGDLKLFFDQVMNRDQNSRFIFTCRPFIQFAGVGSYQIRLEGLTNSDTKDLILKYHQKLGEIEASSMAARLHQCTQGHPLWMALVLAQSRVNPKDVYTILEKLERQGITKSDDNISSLISATILENLWQGLKERERVILRTLSISGLAESEEAISQIISKKLNHNQVQRALKSLKLLNLVVMKEDEGYLELHPLVREFIVHNYGKEDQESYVGLYVSYLDGFIYLLRKKFGSLLEPDEIEHILKKIEILINARKHQEAMDELRVVSGSLLISGYTEDYLRLSDLLLSNLSWSYGKLTDMTGFKEFMYWFFSKSAKANRIDLFDKHMNRYLSVFKTADTHMILAKSAISHKAWIMGDTEIALREGRSASDLVEILEEKDIWTAKHTYNLALRDSKIPEKIQEAMTFFCEGKSIDVLVSEAEDINAANKYGNVARCAMYLGDIERAIRLLCKSYTILTETMSSYSAKHNLGYAAQWIGDFLHVEGRVREAAYFYIHARNLWEDDMPSEANRLMHQIKEIFKGVEYESMTSLENWQITKYCNDWVSRQ
jgi:hypothetical protein